MCMFVYLCMLPDSTKEDVNLFSAKILKLSKVETCGNE